MCKFVGTELKKDQYVLLTGCKVKGENALYKVIHDVANDENYCGDNGYVLNKVKLNGELKESGYTLYFYDNAGIKRDPEVKAIGLNGVEDLKEANKQLKAYLKERDNKSIVNKIEESAEKVDLNQVGKTYIVKMLNQVTYSTNGWYNNKAFKTGQFLEVKVLEGGRIRTELLNKKGEHYAFDTACKYTHSLVSSLTQKVIDNSVVVTIEKVTKESLKDNEVVAEVKTESKENSKNDTTKEIEKVQAETIENNSKDNSNNNVESAITNDNTIKCKVVFNEEKNGIELHFNCKPDADIRNSIKSIGFKWSKFNKVWYIKDSEEVRKQLVNIGLMTEDNKEVNVNNINTNNIEVTKITPIDESNFPIDKTISDRENDGHWTFRTEKRNHQQEILEVLTGYKDTFENILNDCKDNSTKNYYINWFNGFLKRYYNNYYGRLKNNAACPSWICTGRSGLNVNKYNKHMNKNDNLMRELIELENTFNSKIDKLKDSIQKAKQNIIKKDLENITGEIQGLQKQKIDINRHVANNIFTDTNYTINGYNYKDKYYIIKNWGYWRIYDSNGKEIEVLTRCFKSLQECKKGLMYILQEKLKEVITNE